MPFLPHFFTFITLKRSVNMLQTCFSYLISNLFNRVKVNHLPTFIAVEPANFCMLRCPECPVGIAKKAKQKQLMPITLFRHVLEELAPALHTVIFYFQGEPLLHPELAEMIKTAKTKKLYTMLSTNAQLLDSEMAQKLVVAGLDKIIVSVDGATQVSYEQYRVGGNLQKIIAGIGFLRYWKQQLYKNTPLVEVQCLRLKSNEHEWAQMKQTYKMWGADRLVFKTAQFYNFEHGNQLMPSDEKFCRYRQQKNGQWIQKWKLHNRCWRLWSGAVVDVCGNVLPCCFDKSGQFAFGNLHEHSFRDIWLGEKANAFRKQILKQRKAFEMCRNCTSR